MIHHTINVPIKDKHYPIYIGENLLQDSAVLKKHIDNKKVMIVTNATVAKLYLQTLENSLSTLNCDHVILPDGEQYKTIEQWLAILNALTEKNHHRDTSIITLGGGVVGDMGGFAAACYQRGIPFIQIPTTLLSQVDASIGGKTAVNHPAGKNFIGAFHQPKAVIIDLNFLDSLPPREFNAGLSEIIKHAMIADTDFFSWLEKNIGSLLKKDKNQLTHAINIACKIKRDIVVRDEKEQGDRALLNLGHTFAHAIERTLNYGTWLHGEAVATGLLLACKLSEIHADFPAAETARVYQLLKQAQLPLTLPNGTDHHQKIIQAMKMDKKVLKNKLRFILLKTLGNAFICDDISEEELNAACATSD